MNEGVFYAKTEAHSTKIKLKVSGYWVVSHWLLGCWSVVTELFVSRLLRGASQCLLGCLVSGCWADLISGYWAVSHWVVN